MKHPVNEQIDTELSWVKQYSKDAAELLKIYQSLYTSMADAHRALPKDTDHGDKFSELYQPVRLFFSGLIVEELISMVEVSADVSDPL